MTSFAVAGDGLRIAYEIVGEGPPIVLVHGFASDRVQNWKAPGWYDTLTRAGRRAVAMDCRGHGQSDKPHDPAAYRSDKMVGDVLAVMAAAGLKDADVMGYSMGGFIGLDILMEHPDFVRKMVIGGVGGSYLQSAATSGDRMADPIRRSAIADALEAADASTITDPTAKIFRVFAEQNGKDIKALAACMRAPRRNFTADELSRSTRPVLVVCGEKDNLTGPPDPLAAAFADGRALTVPLRDHMTAVGDKVYKQAVLQFLAS